MVGDGAVGKTSLLISYTTNTFPQDYIPTVFDNYSTTVLLPNPYFDEESDDSKDDSQLFKLNLWDTAGQEEYDRLRPLSYPQTDVFLVCFSISEPSSLKNVVDKWCPEILQNSGLESTDFYKKLGKYPIFLVGTKSDLRESAGEAERLKELNSDFVSQDEIDSVVKQCGFIGYVECSAATQSGVREVFEQSVSSVVYDPEKVDKDKLRAERKQVRDQQQQNEKEQQRQLAQEPIQGQQQQQKQKQQQKVLYENSAESTVKPQKKKRITPASGVKYLKKLKKKSTCAIL